MRIIDTDTTTPTARADWDAYLRGVTCGGNDLDTHFDEHVDHLTTTRDTHPALTGLIANDLIRGLLADTDPHQYGYATIEALDNNLTIDTDGDDPTTCYVTVNLTLTRHDATTPLTLTTTGSYLTPPELLTPALTGQDFARFIVTGLAPLIRDTLDTAAYIHHAITTTYCTTPTSEQPAP